MIRESLESGSTHATAFVTSGQGVVLTNVDSVAIGLPSVIISRPHSSHRNSQQKRPQNYIRGLKKMQYT